MRDEEKRAIEIDQKSFQPGDRVDIEMVGRFIQQKNIGLPTSARAAGHAVSFR